MGAIKPAALLLLAALLGAVGWTAYREGRRVSRQSTPPLGPIGPNTEPPLVEFRQVHLGSGVETGTVLTIDHTGLATLQTLPLGLESKTLRMHLSCDEFADLPEQMRYELGVLRSSYGSDRGANQGEISIVTRWDGPERRVVWRNPESGPRPPEGAWAGLVGPLEDIRRRAEETPQAAASTSDFVIAYGHSSSGIVGTYITLLSINKSGRATLWHGLHRLPLVGDALAPEEVSSLLRTIKETKFMDFQQCYGRHAPVNPQNTWIVYRWDGKENGVTWMSDPADPKPPEGWFRIVEILNQIRARVEEQRKGEPAPWPHG
jgi:hypothetical protein